MKLLLAEDTKDLNHVLTVALQHSGYEVDAVLDGEAALQQLQTEAYDAAVLDIMMPKMSGMEVLAKIRSDNNTVPVLLLTAKSGVDDRVAGLEAGADDYLVKPFAMKELLARVGAMTRRRKEYTEDKLIFGDLSLDADTFELHCENTIRLSVKEFELMQVLIRGRDRAQSTSYLLQQVWDSDEDASADTLWLYISYLRGKLRAVASNVTIEGERGGSFVLKKIEQIDA